MDWTKLDWNVLDRLRDGFLQGTAARGPYWKSPADLANYDLTYAERIGWKWDAVLGELKTRGWTPPVQSILDWGCGSGIAGRRVLSAFGSSQFDSLQVWDHSPLACDFAIESAHREFPNLKVERFTTGNPVGLLVLSHVLNELAPAARAELLALAGQAGAILWVEPGTHVLSRGLISLREELRASFRVVAPCTHQAACGLLATENARHWCHAHAAPPPNIYADSDWVKFGQRAGIDLRSLPYSFLALERLNPAQPASPSSTGAARIIGEPRHFKGFATLLSCDQDGVVELILQKRTDPALFKKLERDPGLPLYHWEKAGNRIEKATHLFPEPPAPDA